MSDSGAIIEASSNITSVFGAKSWAKRTNEPIDAYSVFTLFLHSEEFEPSAWIKSLTDDDRNKLPKGYQGTKKLQQVQQRFLWKDRKNDFVNEVVYSAQRKYEYHIEETGGNLSNIVRKLSLLANKSLDKKLKDFEEGKADMSTNQIMQLLKIYADYDAQLRMTQEYNKKKLDLKETPVSKIQQLLTAINKTKKDK